jgi:hypothetical protein
MKRLLPLLFFLAASFSLSSQDSTGIPPFVSDYAGSLGMTISQAMEEFGSPDHMYVYQGDEDEYGSVVFHYGNSISLFWIDDRVWQLRLDDQFTGLEPPGFMGQTMERILEGWGEPRFRDDTLLIYDIPEPNYPVRCALYFDENKELFDLYIFRGDY